MHAGTSPGSSGDLWEIATPARADGMPGVEMAGFRLRGSGPIELRAVPHPALTLVVEFGDRPLVVQDASGRTSRGSVVAGLAPHDVRIKAESLECVQVRLSPLVARAVLDARSGEMAGQVVSLEDLWGPETHRIREQLHHATTWSHRFALLQALLARRVDTAAVAADPEVVWAWAAIRRSHGALRIDDLAAAVGWSRQRLWSRFDTQVGLSPKQAARLVRFDRAVHLLASGRAPGDVAAESGYSDQSHLHREVRSFNGTTPRAAADEPWLAVDDAAWPGR
jgi:AraC-like DNA-binding protein